MKLVGKVPVEPLDDERLTNIERNLVVQVSEMSQRPVRAPHRLLAFAAIAMAILIAGLVGYKLRGSEPVIAPKPEHVAIKGGALDLGDAQITGKDFSITRSDGKVEVALDRPGKLELHVEHKPGRLFVVHAGNVDIEDVGTRFSVDYDGTNVDVRVTEGEVKVKHAGKELAVIAGNAWTIELGPITITQLDQRGAQVAANTTATPPQPNPPVATPTGTGTSAGSSTTAGSTASDNATGSSGSNNGSTSGSGEGSGRRHRVGGPNARKALDPLPDPVVAPSAKDPQAAINDYLRHAKDLTEGEEKVNLLQSIAVLRLRTKNLDSARSAIEGILHERQGSGPWTDWPGYKSALFLDMRMKCVTAYDRDANHDGRPDRAFDDACRIAAQKYLAQYPSGTESGIAQQVLDEI